MAPSPNGSSALSEDTGSALPSPESLAATRQAFAVLLGRFLAKCWLECQREHVGKGSTTGEGNPANRSRVHSS